MGCFLWSILWMLGRGGLSVIINGTLIVSLVSIRVCSQF